MKQGIEDLKEREKGGGARQNCREWKNGEKITEDDWVKVKRRKLENGKQIMKKTDGGSEEKEAESN